MVLEGPDLERNKVSTLALRRSTGGDRVPLVGQRAERTVGKLLRRLRMTCSQPRPYHPKKDPAAQETYKQDFPSLVAEALPASAAGKPIEIWFQDEARVGQKGSLEYIWAPIACSMARDNRQGTRSTYLARSATRAVPARQSSCRPPIPKR